jgi:hypothetical protein
MMMIFAEASGNQSGGSTFGLVVAIVFFAMIWKLHKWKQNAKAAVGNAWQAAKSSPVTPVVARFGAMYFLRRLMR